MWRFWQKHGHLAEARRRLEAMAAAPWSRDDPRLRAKLMEALGGTCWWQGDLPGDDAALPGGARDLAGARRRGASSRTPTTTPRSRTPSCPTRRRATLPTRTASASDTSSRRARSFADIGDRRGEGNAVWGLGNYHYFRAMPRQRRGPVPRDARDLPRGRRPDDGGLGAAHARDRSPAQRAASTRRDGHIAHAIRHFHAAGDASGLTLTFDDLSAVAVADGDLPGRPGCGARPAT